MIVAFFVTSLTWNTDALVRVNEAIDSSDTAWAHITEWVANKRISRGTAVN